MKKNEAISILATSVRPREPKDRTRYDEAVNMAIKALKQPEIVRCKDCMYGEQDDDGWWHCISFGCIVGNEDGSGFCADAERRTDE